MKDTRKIFITCEKFGNLDNSFVFYNLFDILDGIYQIFKKPKMENIKKRMNFIKSNFLIAQNYSIVIGVTEILDKLKNKHPKSKIAQGLRVVCHGSMTYLDH